MNIKIGTGPDSWGIWFPSHPQQTPWERFLDEVREAGYEWTELGPYGYLPTDVAVLRKELDKRGLKAVAAFVMKDLANNDLWPEVEELIFKTAEWASALGAKFLNLIDDTYTDVFTGKLLGRPVLDDSQWLSLAGHANRAGEIAKKFGLKLAFHPHVDTHVEYEDQIDKFLELTNPGLVNLCFDVGHHAYSGGDATGFMRKHYGRIAFLHLKNVDREMQKKAKAEGIPFGKAVGMDVFVEPSKGIIDFVEILDILREKDYDGWAVVEHDMFPCSFDKPLPIAKLTRAYFKEIGMG